MVSLSPAQFEEFYRAATLAIAKSELAERQKADPSFVSHEPPTGKSPFPWQIRLALRACAGDWPRAIALPTAAGKTACIDVAVFALACRAALAPRRVFFVVDRRIVVDQAYLHAKSLASVLHQASDGILKTVADSLRAVAQDERPLDVYALRGGMYRESAWMRSPLQPTIIASTVDQVGSRLLFRGYGVSDSMRPIHAGLIANDALILLDEAHCSKPFDQTMQSVEKYRAWGEGARPPFRFVSITATPTGNVPTERDEEDDRAHPVLGARINASKPAKLEIAKSAKGSKAWPELVKELEKHARELAKEFACVGIIVNRVATARELKAKLGEDAVLLTGRMRPLDRDRLFEQRLRPLLSNADGDPPKFVVGTQCLECGADFDFHALVTECASLDALRQRFGRLNRVAKRPTAKAVIVIRADQAEDTADDPVYGESLANTWKWLTAKATDGFFDFGVAAVRRAIADDEVSSLNAPAGDAPVLFPAHLDCWVQTHPIPQPDPDPAIFLHGPASPGQPDVRVVFRADLGEDSSKWCDIVSLCAPSSSEAVPVPISIFRKWLNGTLVRDDSSDVEGKAESSDDSESPSVAQALRWRGPEKSDVVSSSDRVTPNDVYVVPCSAPAVSLLADFPGPVPEDFAEEAFQRSRDKAILRLLDANVAADADDFEERITEEITGKASAASPKWLTQAVGELADPKRRTVEDHPLGGWVVTGRRRLHLYDPTVANDGEPGASYRGEPVALVDHSCGVASHAHRFAKGCGLDENLYQQAGLWHDLGKLDRRFQAMLKQSSPRTAVGTPLAKSRGLPQSKRDKELAREVHRYPRGGRHELLSAALVSTRTADDLLLHLIATHHGSGRPFASPVLENEAAQAPFDASFLGETFKIGNAGQQIAAWNAELPERFWRVVRKYGWWGAAYSEAVFRLADHEQSRREQERDWKPTVSTDENKGFVAQMAPSRPSRHALPLPGLDGANPLAFLAAVGTLIACTRISASPDRPDWLDGSVALSWGRKGNPHCPVLHLPAAAPSEVDFVNLLAKALPQSSSDHPCSSVIQLLDEKPRNLSKVLRERFGTVQELNRSRLDWMTALVIDEAKPEASEPTPDATSSLQTVRRDYLLGNIREVMKQTRAEHLERTLFKAWDYADSLANQSLHWEPSEDRRHAYQWHMPSGDPTRNKRGGMLGANRLAMEAWPLFPSVVADYQAATRGFKGTGMFDTYFSWPLWTCPLCVDAVGSMLSLAAIQSDAPENGEFQQLNISYGFRCQRILVGKTPNFTTATAIG